MKNYTYDYYYLDSMHYLSTIKDYNTIVTGLSYGINGVIGSRFRQPTVNVAMHCQDLYYDFKHIKKIVSKPQKKIESCILTLSYYSLYYDLSLSSNRYLCGELYKRLFNDMHHVSMSTDISDDNNEADSECVDLFHQAFIVEQDYYGSMRDRKQTTIQIEDGKSWQDMPQEEKESIAKSFAEKHNKHIQHTNTMKENMYIIMQMMDFFRTNDIRPYFVVMPFSKEYLKYINPEYKTIMATVFEGLPYEIDYIDLNDYDIFTDYDFMDCDHLNNTGAEKATQILDMLIHGEL